MHPMLCECCLQFVCVCVCVRAPWAVMNYPVFLIRPTACRDWSQGFSIPESTLITQYTLLYPKFVCVCV